MRPTWKGFVSFGLVAFPVNLYTGVESREEVHFHLLHAADDGRIRYKRVCEACDAEVPWNEVVKGYEQDEVVVEITPEDFEKADVHGSSTIDILDFALEDEIDPRYFERPCYLEPQKGSEKPYALLREALKRTKKVGIAKLVLRTRQQLACIRPDGDVLVAELMRFADEVRDFSELDVPGPKEARERELELAEELVERMTTPFDIAKYRDDYKDKLLEIIAQKLEGKEPEAQGEAPQRTKVVDLMAVLQKSLAEKDGGEKGRRAARRPAKATKNRTTRRKKAG